MTTDTRIPPKGAWHGACYREGCDQLARWLPYVVAHTEPDPLGCYYCTDCTDAIATGTLSHQSHGERKSSE